MKEKKKYSVGFLVFLIISLLLWGIIFHWAKISMVFSFVFYGIVIAYLLVPISRWLEKYMPRSIAVILLFLVIILGLVLFFLLVVPKFIKQLTALIERLPNFTLQLKELIDRLQTSLEDMGLPYSVQATLNELVEEMEKKAISLFKKSLDGVINGVGRIAGLFTVPVLSFYFIKDREYFKKVIMSLIPSKARGSVLKIALQINEVLNQFIRGQLLIGASIGILTTVGYWIIDLPYAMVLGLLAGVFEIIPYFGPFLGAIPAVVIAALDSPSKLFWTIVITLLAQQMEGNIFTPKIMGAHVGLHPVYIIIVLWLGGFFFGVLGMLFAVPMALILKIIFKNIYISIVSSDWSEKQWRY